MTYEIPQDQYQWVKKLFVVTPSGKMSQITRTVVYNKTPLAAVNYTWGIAKGLKYQLYTGQFTALSDLKNAAVTDTGVAVSFNTSDFKKNIKGFGVTYFGFNCSYWCRRSLRLLAFIGKWLIIIDRWSAGSW